MTARRTLRVELPEVVVPAGRLVDRAVSVVAMIVAVVIVGGLVVAAFLEISDTVGVSGSFEPSRVWTVRAPSAGRVLSVDVETGSLVEDKTVLLSLDATEVRNGVDDIQLELAESSLVAERERSLYPIKIAIAEEQVALSEANVQRARLQLLATLAELGRLSALDSVLQSREPYSHVAIDRGRSEVFAAYSQRNVSLLALQQARADTLGLLRYAFQQRRLGERAARANNRLASLEVLSPGSGVVLSDKVHELIGRKVAEGDPLLEVGVRQAWSVQAAVSETDVARIRVGQTVRFDVPFAEGLSRGEIEGRVALVSLEPIQGGSARIQTAAGSPASIAYRLLIEIPQTDSSFILLRGMSVRGAVIVSQRSVLNMLVARIRSVGGVE